jgi:hypothetical protein
MMARCERVPEAKQVSVFTGTLGESTDELMAIGPVVVGNVHG